MSALDARAPKYDGGIVTRLDCVSLGIAVNADGDRFYDEGEDVWPKRHAMERRRDLKHAPAEWLSGNRLTETAVRAW